LPPELIAYGDPALLDRRANELLDLVTTNVAGCSLDWPEQRFHSMSQAETSVDGVESRGDFRQQAQRR
jgi:hypothetical protein